MVMQILAYASQRCSRLLSLGSVGTVGKPSFRVLGRDGPKRFGYSLQEHLFRARPSLLQERLYLRERFLYGIEVRRVGRQQPHPATSRFDQLAHPPAPVRPQPVHHHHLPHTKRGRQEMLHVGLEGLLIGGSLDRHRRPHPRKGHAGHERGVLAAVPWHLAVGPLAFGSTRPRAGHGGVRAALVHPHEQLGGDPPGLFAPSRPLLFVALFGYEGLFLSGHSPGSRPMARLTVAVETLMSRSSSNASRCSSRVRSGLFLSCWGSHASSAAPLRAGGPGTPSLGSKLPVSFLSLSQRLMEGKETEKVFATCSRGTPRSTASSTRDLRSTEYGFMPRVSPRINGRASRCQ